jgi:hypothetical protein
MKTRDAPAVASEWADLGDPWLTGHISDRPSQEAIERERAQLADAEGKIAGIQAHKAN